MAAKMRHLTAQSNLCKEEVEREELDKRSHKWVKIEDSSDHVEGFPKYTEDEISEKKTIAVYQV